MIIICLRQIIIQFIVQGDQFNLILSCMGWGGFYSINIKFKIQKQMIASNISYHIEYAFQKQGYPPKLMKIIMKTLNINLNY